jgi:hypothetical protein
LCHFRLLTDLPFLLQKWILLLRRGTVVCWKRSDLAAVESLGAVFLQAVVVEWIDDVAWVMPDGVAFVIQACHFCLARNLLVQVLQHTCYQMIRRRLKCESDLDVRFHCWERDVDVVTVHQLDDLHEVPYFVRRCCLIQ